MEFLFISFAEMHHINICFVNSFDISHTWVNAEWSCTINTCHCHSKKINNSKQILSLFIHLHYNLLRDIFATFTEILLKYIIFFTINIYSIFLHNKFFPKTFIIHESQFVIVYKDKRSCK